MESQIKSLLSAVIHPETGQDIVTSGVLEQVAMKSVNIQILYRKILEESLIQSQIHAEMLRFESAQDRYVKLVKRQPQLVLRAPLVFIASYLQMTPETLSRVRTAALLEGKM